jgi:uncharacterized membrane protein YtjA (UPF0391 family)
LYRGEADARRQFFPFLKLGRRRNTMLNWALIFLVIGLIAGLLGATGVAAAAANIAWVLLLIGIVLLVVHLFTGRKGGSSTL